MRIVVNLDLCEANAICTRIAPDVFRLDDDDNLHLLDENPPEELRERLERAVRRCPKQAIAIDG